VWDCNLEAVGHEELSKCEKLPDSGIVIGKIGRDFRDGIISTKKNIDLEKETEKLLKAWYDEVKENNIPSNLVYNSAYHNFSAIVRDDSKGIGCTYTTACADGTKFVCVYDSKYVRFLHFTSHLMAVWDCNLEAVGHEELSKCEKLPDSGIVIGKIGREFRDGMRLLATGWARNKQTVYAPIAARMLAVTYNCTDLGKEAKNKSSNCRSDIGDPTPGRAMNKLEIKNYTIPLQDALELAITTWWNQIETEGLPADLKYTTEMETAGKITNFVNMANENVDSVGCAVTQCKPTGVTRVVCEYNTVPITDEAVYTKANKKHCSDCKSINKVCGKDYSEGLCV
ncbi:hypothetical protein ANCDUO_11755, partial [Ancylostoma duodenale]